MNLRGSDVPNCPLPVSYATVELAPSPANPSMKVHTQSLITLMGVSSRAWVGFMIRGLNHQRVSDFVSPPLPTHLGPAFHVPMPFRLCLCGVYVWGRVFSLVNALSPLIVWCVCCGVVSFHVLMSFCLWLCGVLLCLSPLMWLCGVCVVRRLPRPRCSWTVPSSPPRHRDTYRPQTSRYIIRGIFIAVIK